MLEDQGVISVDTDTAVQKYPEIVKKYFGKTHSEQRQQILGIEHRRMVGRIVRLRTEGCACRYSVAGILPYEYAEYGPVRAHVDYCR